MFEQKFGSVMKAQAFVAGAHVSDSSQPTKSDQRSICEAVLNVFTFSDSILESWLINSHTALPFLRQKKTNYTTSGILEELEWLPPQGSQTLKFQDFGLSKVQFFILQSPLSKSCMSHESLACLMWSSCIHSGLEFHPDPAITKNAMPSLPSPQVLRLRNKQQIQRARAEVTSVDISDILEFCLRTGDLEDHLAVVLLLSLLFQNLQRNHTRTANPQQQQKRKKNRK